MRLMQPLWIITSMSTNVGLKLSRNDKIRPHTMAKFGQPHKTTPQQPSPPDPAWKRLLSNSTFQGGISIVALVVGVTLTFLQPWLFRSTVDPVYTLLGTNVVAERRFPRLAVQWDGQAIENLCVSRVAIWNAGNTPIRSDQFIQSNPIRVVPLAATRILNADTIHASRHDLPVSIEIGDERKIHLRFGSDEALEQNDGIVLRILHSGQSCSTVGFRVEGRVIGNKDGFRAYSTVGWDISPVRVLGWLSFAGSLFLILASLSALSSKVLPRAPKVSDVLILASLVALLSACPASIWAYVYFQFLQGTRVLPWMP